MENTILAVGDIKEQTGPFGADESNGQLQGQFFPLLQEVALLAAPSLEAAYCSVSEATKDQHILRISIFPPRQAAETTPARGLTISRTRTIAGHALQTGNATVSPDLRGDPRFDDRALVELGLVSALVLPLVHEEHHFGTVGFYRTEVKPFPLDQVCFVERLFNALNGFLHELDSGAGNTARKHRTNTVKQDWPSGQELRSRPRHRYNYAQTVAPVVSEALPEAGDFFPVECRDVSSGGLAFVTPRKLPSDRVVVTLGRAPACTHILAQILHVQEVQEASGRAYQYGCRFLERVYL